MSCASGNEAKRVALENRRRLDRVEKEVRWLTDLSDLQIKLLYTLAEVLQDGLHTMSPQYNAIRGGVNALSDLVEERLRAEAALARDLREIPVGPPNEQVTKGGKVRDKEE